LINQKGNHEMPTDAKELLTIQQAAAALDKSVPTLRRWIQRRKLAHYRIGGEIRFDRADLAALIAAGRRLPIVA
jgi:excisionase family DNA binding protein